MQNARSQNAYNITSNRDGRFLKYEGKVLVGHSYVAKCYKQKSQELCFSVPRGERHKRL